MGLLFISSTVVCSDVLPNCNCLLSLQFSCITILLGQTLLAAHDDTDRDIIASALCKLRLILFQFHGHLSVWEGAYSMGWWKDDRCWLAIVLVATDLGRDTDWSSIVLSQGYLLNESNVWRAIFACCRIRQYSVCIMYLTSRNYFVLCVHREA